MGLQVRLTGSDGQDGEDMKLSVFYVFAELFPEAVGEYGAGGKLCAVVVSMAVTTVCRPALLPRRLLHLGDDVVSSTRRGAVLQ